MAESYAGFKEPERRDGQTAEVSRLYGVPVTETEGVYHAKREAREESVLIGFAIAITTASEVLTQKRSRVVVICAVISCEVRSAEGSVGETSG